LSSNLLVQRVIIRTVAAKEVHRPELR
jgi:hypothetical protein